MTSIRLRGALGKWALSATVTVAVGVVVAACGTGVGADGANNNNNLGGGSCAGCACSPDGATVNCGYVKERVGDYVTCAEGTATCTGGVWSACQANNTVIQSVQPISLGGGLSIESLGMNSDAGDAGDAGQTNCAANPCDPACQTFVDNSNGVDAGPGLVPTDAGGWTLKSPDGSISLDGGTQCFVTLTGTVYDPAALNPVPNAVVAIPFAGTPAGSGSPPALATGVPLSDACGGTAFSALRATTSALNGTFSLPGVPAQTAVTVVVQTGRWRRSVTVNTSACACGSTINISPTTATTTCIGTTPTCSGNGNYAGTAGCLTRLPRTQSEGNIPHIAIGTGALDPEECTLYRMGVSSSEFTDENGTGRVHMFVDSANGSGGSTLPSPAANHDISYLLGFTCPQSVCPGSTTVASTSGIVNPDFETGNLNGWTTTGSPVTNDSAAAYSGSDSAQMGDTKSKKTGTQTLTQTGMTAPANAASFQFYAQRHCGGGGDDFGAKLTDTTSGSSATWNPQCHNSNNWIQYTASPVIAGHVYTLQLVNDNPQNDQSYTYVDDLSWQVTGTATSLLNNYDLVMLPCDGGKEYYSWSWDNNQGDYTDDVGRQNLVSYANIGGRLFTSHWGREWIERTDTTLPNGPFPGVATWLAVGNERSNPPSNQACAPYATNGNNCNEADPTTGYFNKSSPSVRPGNLAAWMGTVNGGNTSTLTINGARYDVTAITASSVDFVDANSDDNGETAHDVVQDFTFDTPIGSSTAYGRVMYTDMHLASGSTSGNFPGNCPNQGTTLTTQEDAAEFLLFDLGNCVTGQSVPGNLPPVVTTGNGTNSTCSGGSSNDNKIEPSSCTTNADCEMDFNCSSGTCVWSGGIGYTDPTCTDANGNPAVDLTIGVPCATGTGKYDIPICNRGTGTLASGTAINIENSGNGGSASSPWNCAGPPSPNPPNVSAGSATCTYVLPVALGPGQCTDIDTTTTAGAACAILETGERFLYVNYDQSIPECGTGFSGTGPGCMNNTSHTKATGSGCPPTCGGSAGSYAGATFTRDFYGSCPAGDVPVWHFFSWSGLTPLDSSLDFTAWTADTEAQLAVQYPTGATLENPAPDNHANGYVDSHVYSVDVDTRLLAVGDPPSDTPPHASHAWLRVNMTLTPSSDGTQAPTLLTWNQAYDCVADQ